jgi:hypothetical protein
VITYADTGFVVSLYKLESTSARAAAVMQGLSGPVWLSPLVELELRNAFQLAVFRQEIGADEATLKWRLFAGKGVFVIRTIPLLAWFASAGELSERHSASRGTRSLDLMHVAAAMLLEATVFLSLDDRQRKAAAAEGLGVFP